MKKIEFYQVENPISMTDIEDFEKKYNIKFPKEYKKLLLKFNGGVPSDRTVYIDGEEGSIGGFYSIKYGETLVEDAIKTFQITEKLIPVSCIPFAYDGFGNPYCISTDKGDYGNIYCWYFDTGDLDGSLVADSLEEFLGGNL